MDKYKPTILKVKPLDKLTKLIFFFKKKEKNKITGTKKVLLTGGIK
jgi:hypothetical protein